jgi:hypothetical protein
MSLPKSKILYANKSFVAQAKLAYGSQKQSQSVTVNISPDLKSEVESDPIKVSYKAADNNPYTNLELPSSVEEFKRILEQKDRIIQAFNLIIEIIKNNPLLINKYIIAEAGVLVELIKLLSNSNEVEIIEKDTNIDCSCTCSSASNLVLVDKIFVIRGGETLNLKYSFPDVIKTLDEHRISTKICTV